MGRRKNNQTAPSVENTGEDTQLMDNKPLVDGAGNDGGEEVDGGSEIDENNQTAPSVEDVPESDVARVFFVQSLRVNVLAKTQEEAEKKAEKLFGAK